MPYPAPPPPSSHPPEVDRKGQREPLFNLPAMMIVLLLMLTGLHFWLQEILSLRARYEFIWNYGFIPLNLLESFERPSRFQIWILSSLLSYSFLHGDWTHLGLNLIWMVIFGSPLIRCFGTVRFMLFWLVMAGLSACAYFVFNMRSPIPMIGASGVIAAMTGAAARYGFYRSGMGSGFVDTLLPMRLALMNKNVMPFVSIWLLANLALAFSAFLPETEIGNIAWEAHIGGLVAGFVLTGLFSRNVSSARQGR